LPGSKWHTRTCIHKNLWRRACVSELLAPEKVADAAAVMPLKKSGLEHDVRCKLRVIMGRMHYTRVRMRKTQYMLRLENGVEDGVLLNC